MNLLKVNKYLSLALATLILTVVSCERGDDLRNPIENNTGVPGKVSNVRIKNLNGGARLTYTIPSDEDLLYVQAVYRIKDEIVQEVTASYYANSMELKGFGDTLKHEVELYTVNRSGRRSEPTVITVKPLIPPVQMAFKSLSYTPDFGGVVVDLENEVQADLVTTVLVKNSRGEWEDYDKNYSSLKKIRFSVRGLPARPTEFGVFVEDQWGNLSDTLFKQLTPFFEEQMDKEKFSEVHYPNEPQNIWYLDKLWDNNIDLLSGFHSTSDAGTPVWFSFDMGVKAKLSRLKTWGLNDRAYSSGEIREFEVWGSNDPDPSGSFDGWTKLAEFEVVKPSGLPQGELSDEDKQMRENGNEQVFPVDIPIVRYLRFNIISTFEVPANSTSGAAWITELSLWGQVMN